MLVTNIMAKKLQQEKIITGKSSSCTGALLNSTYMFKIIVHFNFVKIKSLYL
jgi:hypothetical protein